MSIRPHVVVLDPAVHTPEIECLNKISQLSRLPLHYHLPALYGPGSLPDNLDGIAGIVVMGSASSVNERLPWQGPMNAWLREAIDRRIPIFGICYGHQLIAHLFGGKVDFIYPDRRKLLGFRQVQLLPNPLWKHEAREGSLFVSHCEVVVEVPPELKVTARSTEIAIEGLMHATLPIWSFQPHPEAGPHFAIRRNLPLEETCTAFGFGHELVKAFLDYVAESGSIPLKKQGM